MTGLPKLSIKKGREWQLLRGHPWLFSGAISQAPSKSAPGDVVDLVDVGGAFIARGYYNSASDISVRVLTLDSSEDVDRDFLRRRLRDAMELRRLVLNEEKTNVYRLINAEGDRLPGVVVDRFADVMVVQSHTAGADRLLPDLLELLAEEAQPRAIILRNDAPVRKREGLQQEPPQVVHGDSAADFTNIDVRENGFVFTVDLISGQKTGFFADQREKRSAVAACCERLPPKSAMANIFSYSGSVSIYALKSNPHLQTVNVDESSKALELARKNFAGNAIALTDQSFVEADAFKWLEEQVRNTATFQFVILDPPAFAKSHKDKDKAIKAYARLNKLGLLCCAPGAFFLTCSCSGAVSLEEFQSAVRNGAADADRSLQILQVFKNSADHPVNVAATETEYLKVLLCRVQE
jgi:23S rRNA (cytosine1962-C5)-methyltransferase